LTASGGETDLGKLRGLAGTGLAADDDHRMFRNRSRDLGGALRNREIRRIRDRRPPRAARLALLDRAGKRDGDPVPFRERRVSTPGTLNASGERNRVGGTSERQLGGKKRRGRRRAHAAESNEAA